MPFPLAHPAAVLPLRRFCPRLLNFPALVIGSLVPDFGYGFGPLHLEKFSHRFVAGSFGFCLPVGLLLLLLFYPVRWPAVQQLPARHRRIFEPFCLRPRGRVLPVVISLLVGAWTHIILDSITHQGGWLANHFAILQESVMAGNYQLPAYDILYSITTFAGVAYVSMAYLNSVERVTGTPGWIFPGFKWIATLLLAVLTLLLSVANHVATTLLGLAIIGFLTVILVIGFFEMTELGLRNLLPAGKHDQLKKAGAIRTSGIQCRDRSSAGEH